MDVSFSLFFFSLIFFLFLLFVSSHLSPPLVFFSFLNYICIYIYIYIRYFHFTLSYFHSVSCFQGIQVSWLPDFPGFHVSCYFYFLDQGYTYT
ncbi:hypothetical protein BZA77DRAFT_310951 [Pyronema omphalodes]|nr:hypothetical protein BZA77DRAFT_310951 [Pyronema omphalodes]